MRALVIAAALVRSPRFRFRYGAAPGGALGSFKRTSASQEFLHRRTETLITSSFLVMAHDEGILGDLRWRSTPDGRRGLLLASGRG